MRARQRPRAAAALTRGALRRFRTIVSFSLLYVCGLAMLTCCAGLVPSWAPAEGEAPTARQTTLLFVGLYAVALGTGGIKPNVSAFGADQFDLSNPRHVSQKASFFNWFYLVINVGSLLAATVVVYVQENVSWKVGFAVPTLAMAVAVCFFVGGSRRYRHAVRKPGATSPIARTLAVVALAGAATLRDALRGLVKPAPASAPLLSVAEADAEAAAIEAAAEEAAAARAAAIAAGEDPLDVPVSPPATPSAAAAAATPRLSRWLARATIEQGGRYTTAQVEEVAMVLALLPVFCTGIVYWMCYAQMGSVFVEQGAQMDRRLGRSGMVVPAATLSSFDTLAVIVLIPLFEKGLYPAFKRAGRPLRPLQRTGAGHILAAAAMLAAAVLERVRLDKAARGQLLPPEALGLDPDAPGVVALSVFWQAPQYLLIGASEVLAAVAQLELYYDQAPDSMRSCSMALQLVATACGGYAASALLSAVAAATEARGTPWIAQDLNHGRLDLFFLLLALCMVLNFCFFLFVASRYTIKRVPHGAEAAAAAAALARSASGSAGRPPRPPRGASAPIGLPSAVRSVRAAVSSAASLPRSFAAGFYGRSLVVRPESPAGLTTR